MQQLSDGDGNETTDSPRATDILCGRGLAFFYHAGNVSFRVAIASNVAKYIAAQSKNEKTLVVRAVVQGILESGARFLKKHGTKGGLWIVAGPKTCRQKVGHALRDASTNKVQCVATLHKHMQDHASLHDGHRHHDIIKLAALSSSSVANLCRGGAPSKSTQLRRLKRMCAGHKDCDKDRKDPQLVSDKQQQLCTTTTRPPCQNVAMVDDAQRANQQSALLCAQSCSNGTLRNSAEEALPNNLDRTTWFSPPPTRNVTPSPHFDCQPNRTEVSDPPRNDDASTLAFHEWIDHTPRIENDKCCLARVYDINEDDGDEAEFRSLLALLVHDDETKDHDDSTCNIKGADDSNLAASQDM